MTDLSGTQTELLCPSCAGQRVFDPTKEALRCQSCGRTEKLGGPWDAKAEREFPYDPDAPASEQPSEQSVRVHSCQTCGGEVVFVGPSLSESCPYCDGPVVLREADIGYDAMALIPFVIDEETAQNAVLRWAASRTAAPNDLMAHVSQGRVAGLYAPFWTFDSREAIEYWAQQVKRRGKRWTYRQIRGRMRIFFDDMLVPASPHVTPLIRDGILHHFQPERLRHFNAGYLSGFAAELHHQTVTDGLNANAADKDVLIRNRIRQHINRQGITNIGYRTDTSGIHYRRLLLPVWILHYTYRDTAYKIVASGMDRRAFGERPYSKGKLVLLSAVLTLIALAFGIGWGAGGLP